MTRIANGALLRLGAGAVMAGGMSVGMTNAWAACAESCGGGCWIGTSCSSCSAGDPNDCTIYWDSGDQECDDHFVCHWSCPAVQDTQQDGHDQ